MSLVKLAAVCWTSALLLIASAAQAGAQQTALSTTGSPGTFTISTATAGSQPLTLTNSATSYSVTAKNSAGPKKIIAQLDAPMPFGTTLTVNMVAPSGATSMGAVALDATTRDIVINIVKENSVTQGITYTFAATAAAGVIPAQSRTVTFTLVNYP